MERRIGIVSQKQIKKEKGNSMKFSVETASSNMEFEYEYDEELGGIAITKYTGEFENVIIPDKLDGKTVVRIGEEAFYECGHIVSVKISESVMEIGKGAFGWCINLVSANIPRGVTEIKSDVFFNCENLAGITIHDGVTKICSNAFDSCESITDITIPESVTDISVFTFDCCINIRAAYKGKIYDYKHIRELYGEINGESY